VPALIETLLSSPDTVEVVRDKIASILALECAKQGELGLDLVKVPRVFLERSNPWGMLVENPVAQRPIVNVWFDTETFDGAASSVVDRQKADATFNIDVYASGESAEAGAGHTPGDELAAINCHAALRLVRQIIMSGYYTYLDLPRGIVWRRFPQTLSVFQPTSDGRAVSNVVAGRIALVVGFNEMSPQVASQLLESLRVEVIRQETGELYLRAQYGEESP
jgi:hypothetical protein